LLLEEAQRDSESDSLNSIQTELVRLANELDEVMKAMQEPAELAGSRRS
jgi:hypothetical protein